MAAVQPSGKTAAAVGCFKTYPLGYLISSTLRCFYVGGVKILRKDDGHMAKGRNTKLGIVYSNSEVHVVRKMGVPEQNIVGVGRMNDVISRMTAGDSLCVPSVKSFSYGAYDLFCKMQYLANNGIEFQSGNERYLSFSAVKPLPLPTVETLRDFAARESEFIRWVQSSGLDQKSKAALSNKIYWEFMADVVLVFGNNGIKKKGN